MPTVLLLVLATACGEGPGPEPARPASGDAAMARAREAAAVGNWRLAEETLRQEVAARPQHEAAWVALGNMQARTGRLKEAAAAWVQLSTLRPANGLYALKAGSFLEASRQSHAAGPYLEKAFRLRPRDADAAYRYGLHLFHAGLYDRSAAALRRGADLAGGRSDLVLKLAQAEMRQGRFEAALQVLDEALAARQDEPLLFFQRGLVRTRAGLHQAAAADYRRVLDLDPEQHRAAYALARALTASGRAAEGQSLMETFAAGEESRRQRETDRLVSHLARAGAQDDPAGNRRRLQDLALQEPDNAAAHRLLAEAYALEGDYQEAVASYDRVLLLQPEDETSNKRREALLDRLGAGSGP